jgi:hypothetical protein
VCVWRIQWARGAHIQASARPSNPGQATGRSCVLGWPRLARYTLRSVPSSTRMSAMTFRIVSEQKRTQHATRPEVSEAPRGPHGASPLAVANDGDANDHTTAFPICRGAAAFAEAAKRSLRPLSDEGRSFIESLQTHNRQRGPGTLFESRHLDDPGVTCAEPMAPQQPRIEATRHLRRGRAGRRALPSPRRSGR